MGEADTPVKCRSVNTQRTGWENKVAGMTPDQRGNFPEGRSPGKQRKRWEEVTRSWLEKEKTKTLAKHNKDDYFMKEEACNTHGHRIRQTCIKYVVEKRHGNKPFGRYGRWSEDNIVSILKKENERIVTRFMSLMTRRDFMYAIITLGFHKLLVGGKFRHKPMHLAAHL
jgi:hypothetical protein